MKATFGYLSGWLEFQSPWMERTSALKKVGTCAVALCVGFVLSGAAFFGLSSCGGYAWHKDLFNSSALLLCALAIALPSSPLSSIKKKALFAVALPVVYVLVESAIAPFYPGPPDSFWEYGKQFVSSLRFGPCG